MALEQKLSLRLSQKLVMTPSLQQAIKLLQMTRLELESVVSQELVENPLLEEVEETAPPVEPVDEAAPVREQVAEPEVEVQAPEALAEVDFEAYFGDDSELYGPPGEREYREAPPLENTLTQGPDLCDHLQWQVAMSALTPRQRDIAELIIGNLDPDGFLVATPEEIRLLGNETATPPLEPEEVIEVLRAIQQMDPPGVACNDLRESLQRQLIARGFAASSLPHRIVAEMWEPLLRRQYQAVAKALGVELHELEPAVAIIRTLETRPGRLFAHERAQYIEPDVVVVKIGDDYVVQLNDDGLPRLRISRSYRRMLQRMRQEGKQADAQQFIRDKMRSAVWLIKSLDQRQRTIYKVAESIVRQQRDFLDHGLDRLRPMVLRDVAEDIGMHESTVSRVVSNKYMHTPRGLFAMKFFFHSGIDRDYGDDISSLTVKRKIKQLIESEDARRPLSDSDLMRILNREGIHIARRTVAKYRDELGMPSSADRKQVF